MRSVRQGLRSFRHGVESIEARGVGSAGRRSPPVIGAGLFQRNAAECNALLSISRSPLLITGRGIHWLVAPRAGSAAVAQNRQGMCLVELLRRRVGRRLLLRQLSLVLGNSLAIFPPPHVPALVAKDLQGHFSVCAANPRQSLHTLARMAAAPEIVEDPDISGPAPSTAVVVPGPSKFTAAFDKAAEDGPVIVVFVGSADKKTGAISWCPDCVKTIPIITSVLESMSPPAAFPVVWCLVQRDGYKGNPSHPYRTTEPFKLTSVPTVLKVADGKVTGRCVDDECLSETDLRALVEST
jgi:thiol-disulfide isomerase/thioredoxin